MKIRYFHESDTNDVVALWQACGLCRPWNNPHLDIQRKCSVNDKLFLVGEMDDNTTGERAGLENGQVIASVMGSYDGHRGWIYYLAIDPRIQRQGLGEKLMQDIEKRLLALGCPKINLQIRRENNAVIAFYESLGFKEDASVSLGKRLIPDN